MDNNLNNQNQSAPIGQAQNTQEPAQNNAPANPNSTQNTLEIAELREGMAVMKDGSFRAVIACKSINYDLMSSREREGVEYSYQNFYYQQMYLQNVLHKNYLYNM